MTIVSISVISFVVLGFGSLVFEHVDKNTRGIMIQNNYEAGIRHTPAIENCATLYSNDSQLYISNASIDLQQLKNEPVVRDFANVTPETYDLIKLTNPTLLIFVDLAKRIVEAEG